MEKIKALKNLFLLVLLIFSLGLIAFTFKENFSKSSLKSQNKNQVLVSPDKEILGDKEKKEMVDIKKLKPIEEALSLWSTALGKKVKLEDFNFEKEEAFQYPFNEVILDGREKRIPGWQEATVYSPNKKMWVNCLYSYEKEKFSSCVLFNPKGEKRLYRISFCSLSCRFYKAWWLDNKEILIAEVTKDLRNCNKGLNCPDTLAYRVYNLEKLKYKRYLYKDSLGNLMKIFPKAVCEIYPPCKAQEK